jgi:FkbM family methyltransferase
LKTPLFHRLCAALARRQPHDSSVLIKTNLGICPGLRCDVPIEKSAYAFGRPDHNLSERSTLALVSLLSNECAHFVDVGAHEGIFTFVVAQSGNSGTRLHWFEPDDVLCARLERNLAVNNVAASGSKKAVSNRRGTAIFYQNLSDDASGSLTDDFAQKHATRQQAVETVPLGEYFASNQIEDALVKVDVEGHGSGVWEGARSCIGKIKYLVMEVIGGETRANLPARIVAETGWHAYYLRDFDVVHSRDGGFDYVAPFWNWLFCRVDPRELSQKLANTKFRVCERT